MDLTNRRVFAILYFHSQGVSPFPFQPKLPIILFYCLWTSNWHLHSTSTQTTITGKRPLGLMKLVTPIAIKGLKNNVGLQSQPWFYTSSKIEVQQVVYHHWFGRRLHSVVIFLPFGQNNTMRRRKMPKRFKKFQKVPKSFRSSKRSQKLPEGFKRFQRDPKDQILTTKWGKYHIVIRV